MPPREAGGLSRWLGALPEPHHFLHNQVTEYPMVSVTAVVGEETEEEKYIPHANAMIVKMRLRGTGLTEGTAATLEHGIVVAQTCCRQAPFRHPRDDVSKAEIAIGRLGSPLSWDWEADGTPAYDRGRGAARPTVEPLSAEYDFHPE